MIFTKNEKKNSRKGLQNFQVSSNQKQSSIKKLIKLLFYITSYKLRTFSIFSNFLSIEIRFICLCSSNKTAAAFDVMLWKITKLSPVYLRTREREKRKVFPIPFLSLSLEDVRKLNYISTLLTSAMGVREKE